MAAAAPRGFRTFEDIAVDLSDIPNVLNNFYTWIGKAEQEYGDDNVSFLLSSKII